MLRNKVLFFWSIVARKRCRKMCHAILQRSATRLPRRAFWSPRQGSVRLSLSLLRSHSPRFWRCCRLSAGKIGVERHTSPLRQTLTRVPPAWEGRDVQSLDGRLLETVESLSPVAAVYSRVRSNQVQLDSVPRPWISCPTYRGKLRRS
jgi:hypothetical protein